MVMGVGAFPDMDKFGSGCDIPDSRYFGEVLDHKEWHKMNMIFFKLTDGQVYGYKESDYEINSTSNGYVLVERENRGHRFFFPYANILIKERVNVREDTQDDTQ